MANDCSNRLHIYCDNEQILEKIHDLFYQDEDGEIQYTMMKLVPIPADKHDDEGNALSASSLQWDIGVPGLISGRRSQA